MKRLLRRLGIGIALVLSTRTASAAPTPEEKAFAEALFRQAREAMSESRLEEACAKFAESQRIDPALGTLLNLAVCHEKQGRVASAWAEFADAAAEAEHDQAPERVSYARDHAARLEAMLAYLALDVPTPRPADLDVRLDGRVMKEASWGAALPTDPGRHTIVVTAPGKRTWQTEVEIAGVKTTARVAVPVLDDAGAAPPPAAQTAVETMERPRVARVAALTSGGVGVAGLAVGTIFGALALHEKSLRSAVCNGENVCSSQSGVDADRSARTDALVSTVAFIVGGGGLAAGALTYFFWPKHVHEAAPVATRLAPWLGRGGGGVEVLTTW